MQFLYMLLLTGMAVFMILIVLVQKGRGGGLAGAFGGPGGQSAFGAKAGDTFTKITMWAAFLWIVLCVVAVLTLPGRTDPRLEGFEGGAGEAPSDADADDLLRGLFDDTGPLDREQPAPDGTAAPGLGEPTGDSPAVEPGRPGVRRPGLEVPSVLPDDAPPPTGG